MKKYALFPLMGVSLLALAACNTGTTNSDSSNFSKIADTVAKVQQIAADSCKFVPLANTVVQIMNLNNPALSSASEIANSVCNAINLAKTPRGPNESKAGANVQGVPVEGRFVQ